MKTDLAPTSSDLSLLPRADLPVIWDGFRAKAEELRVTAETLTVTSVEQKTEMELARTTRLTLKQIRVEVEKKRVELGEGHLSEIQKINKAAKAIREAIEPLEARLLVQEGFAERAEKARIAALSASRAAEIRSVSTSAFIGSDLGDMPEEIYQNHMKVLRSERAEREENLRRQTEAAAVLAAQKAEAEARLEVERAELHRQNERIRREYEAQQAEAQREARAAAAVAEYKLAEERAESARVAAEIKAKADAQLAEAQAESDRQQAESERMAAELHAEQLAELRLSEAKRLELEVQLANERAAKLAEERRLHALAVAPDKEQLQAFHNSIYQVPQPDLKTPEAVAVFHRVQCKIAEAFLFIDVFCAE